MGLDKIKSHFVASPLKDTTDHNLILLSIVIDEALQCNSKILSSNLKKQVSRISIYQK